MVRDEIQSTLARALPELRREFRVRALYLFGSVARGDENTLSDVDILVEFESGSHPTLFTLAGLYGRIHDLLGRPVDLGTIDSLRPQLRDSVHREMLRVA